MLIENIQVTASGNELSWTQVKFSKDFFTNMEAYKFIKKFTGKRIGQRENSQLLGTWFLKKIWLIISHTIFNEFRNTFFKEYFSGSYHSFRI